MTSDYYVWLACNREHCQQQPPEGLASGPVDAWTVESFAKGRESATKRYVDYASDHVLRQRSFDMRQRVESPDFTRLVCGDWLGVQVCFELLTPWYSKDDRVFHVLHNPVRKDRVFGVPFMSAASWKGLLRWACLMQKNLRKHPEEGKSAEESRDSDWILPLFGNEKGEKEHFHQGALVFYPTWFDKVGFEVINPHSRERRAGTQPIYYEVVPPGAQGTLYLLYAPWPGMAPKVDPKDFMPGLLEAIEALLTTYGISAKRTVGWGTAKITKWQAFRKGEQSPKVDCRKQLEQIIHAWFETGGTR